MEIYVDTVSLRDKCNDMQVVSNDIKVCMNKLESVLIETCEQWEGDAEKAFAGRVLYMKKEYMELVSFIDEYISFVRRASDFYDMKEDEIKSKMGAV